MRKMWPDSSSNGVQDWGEVAKTPSSYIIKQTKFFTKIKLCEEEINIIISAVNLA